jgi:hypothetical protein
MPPATSEHQAASSLPILELSHNSEVKKWKICFKSNTANSQIHAVNEFMHSLFATPYTSTVLSQEDPASALATATYVVEVMEAGRTTGKVRDPRYFVPGGEKKFVEVDAKHVLGFKRGVREPPLAGQLRVTLFEKPDTSKQSM